MLPVGIPDEGKVLAQMEGWWFDRTKDLVPNHLIRIADGTPADDLPFALPPATPPVVKTCSTGSGPAHYDVAVTIP